MRAVTAKYTRKSRTRTCGINGKVTDMENKLIIIDTNGKKTEFQLDNGLIADCQKIEYVSDNVGSRFESFCSGTITGTLYVDPYFAEYISARSKYDLAYALSRFNRFPKKQKRKLARLYRHVKSAYERYCKWQG